jgi:hypothetical protein
LTQLSGALCFLKALTRFLNHNEGRTLLPRRPAFSSFWYESKSASLFARDVYLIGNRN